MKWIRTCQECGHEQECPAPIKAKDGSTFNVTNWYRQRNCKKCKSPSLDYGSYQPSTEEEKKAQLKYLESLEQEE